MKISTHVLDTARGKGAANILVTLERHSGEGEWHRVANASTDNQGRIAMLYEEPLYTPPGSYRLHFSSNEYFKQQGLRTLFPFIEIVFETDSNEQHYHIPLLLTANGYTTYRGS